MLEATPVHAESARYATSLLFLPDLWAPARVWLPAATYFGHRGWEGQLLELRGAGDLVARTAALVEHAGRLPRAPVLIGHGAGALVGLRAAGAGVASAVVLVAPLVPGSAGVRALTRRWDALIALARGRPIPPPRDAAARRIFGEVPADLGGETARAVLDVVRGQPPAARPLGIPTLVVAGERDPLLRPRAAAALASALSGDFVEIAGAAHWPILAPGWQHTVAEVHRWLVRRLGQALLDFYAEAMAEREGNATEPDDD
jgi:pimeloyl-ACP methyl ester carboxylesterase